MLFLCGFLSLYLIMILNYLFDLQNIVPRDDKSRFVTLISRDEKGRRGRFTEQNLKSNPLKPYLSWLSIVYTKSSMNVTLA